MSDSHTATPPAGHRRAKILIVDDEFAHRKHLESLLATEGYEVQSASTGEDALNRVPLLQPDLVLLDLRMPGMDGKEVAGRLKQDPLTKHVPIIVVTALDTRDAMLAAFNMGAEEFLTKPVDKAELWVRVRNLLRMKHYGDLLADHNRVLEEQVRARTKELTLSLRETIDTLTRASSYRDEEPGGHVRCISAYCVELAEALGMDPEFCDCIRHASPMHDVGKIAIPDAILFKTGELTAEEWEVLKTHTVLGAQMLEHGDSPYLRMGRDIAATHHERWDGSGYPAGLRGGDIPPAARIMGIADVYDALRSPRAYRAAVGHDAAAHAILRGDGRMRPAQFDPAVLAAFERCLPRLREIYEETAD